MYWIVLEGACGSGKSWTIDCLYKQYGADERVAFFKEEPIWLRFKPLSQLWFDALELWLGNIVNKTKVLYPKAQIVVSDRSMEAIKVFHPEFEPRFYDFQADCHAINKTILINTPYKLTEERILQRNRPFEMEILKKEPDYYEKLHKDFATYPFMRKLEVKSSENALTVLQYDINHLLKTL